MKNKHKKVLHSAGKQLKTNTLIFFNNSFTNI